MYMLFVLLFLISILQALLGSLLEHYNCVKYRYHLYLSLALDMYCYLKNNFLYIISIASFILLLFFCHFARLYVV